MEFEIEDIIHRKLTGSEFYKKYDRYIREGVMMDVAPLFLVLIGKLTTNKKKQLLKAAFKYGMDEYNALNKFLKLCKVNINKIIITPQILFELISHFQKSYMKMKEGRKEVIDEFMSKHLALLKSAYKDVCMWDIMNDDKMIFLECADISFLICATPKKYITLLTQDDDFWKEGAKCQNILSINFNKILINSRYIPEAF